MIPSGMHKIMCIVVGLVATLSSPASPEPKPEQESRLAIEPKVPAVTATGYGLSVFRGTEPERFEVEVLGEFGGIAVGDDYILARLTGAGLEDSGVIAGMSGSPVYVDGELIGAVAFAWPFSEEAIGGITPIDSMRRQLLAPSPQTLRRPVAEWPEVAGPSVGWSGLFDLTDVKNRLRQRLAVLAPRPTSEGRVALQLAASGLADTTREWLTDAVGGVSAAGSVSPDSQLLPGSAVAGILVDGDWKLAVTGTVTDIEGDRVLAFGHPFIGNGSTDLPMAPAEIVSVVSNQFSSFKVSNFGEPVGRFDFDRSTGVGGQIGEAARTIPLRVAMEPAGQQFSMQLARVPELLPVLAGLSVFQSTAAAGHLGGNYGLEVRTRFDLGKDGHFDLHSFHDGTAAVTTAAFEVIQFVDFLYNNVWQETDIEAIDVEVTQHPQPLSRVVESVTLGRSRVEVGDRVHGSVRVRGYRRPADDLPFSFEVPADLPAGAYQLLVGDARSIDLARWAATGEQPRTLPQALRLLRGLRDADTLAVAGLRQAGGVSVEGVALPGLPPTMARVLADGSSTSPVPWRVESLLEQSSESPLSGVVRVQLQVDESEPSSAKSEGTG